MGFMSRASTAPGFLKLVEVSKDTFPRHMGMHRGVTPLFITGEHGKYQVGLCANYKKIWMTQLCFYKWMVNADIVGIEQLAFSNPKNKEGKFAYVGDKEQKVNIGSFRFCIPKKEEQDLKDKIKLTWDLIQNEHYYPKLSKQQSDARVQLLGSPVKWALSALGKERKR